MNLISLKFHFSSNERMTFADQKSRTDVEKLKQDGEKLQNEMARIREENESTTKVLQNKLDEKEEEVKQKSERIKQLEEDNANALSHYGNLQSNMACMQEKNGSANAEIVELREQIGMYILKLFGITA